MTNDSFHLIEILFQKKMILMFCFYIRCPKDPVDVSYPEPSGLMADYPG